MFSFKEDKRKGCVRLKFTVLTFSLIISGHAFSESNFKQKVNSLLQPSSDQNFKSISLQDFSKNTPSNLNETSDDSVFSGDMTSLGAVIAGLKSHPKLVSAIADLSSQNDYLRVAKSAYYPQISSELATGDFDSKDRGRQVYSISANQMVYDFGKTKSSVDQQNAELMKSQATVIKTIDDLSYEIMEAVINIIRYEELSKIADNQVKGIDRIREIARLRVEAGISTQADYVQATSRYQNAQTTALMQKSLVIQWRDKLGALLGGDVSNVKFTMPESIVANSDLYGPIDLNIIPQIISANANILGVNAEKNGVDRSNYPTLSLVGTVSQAINGINPSNGKDNGADSSIMLKATSSMYQGGATSARKNAMASAEVGAKANLRSIELEINTQVRSIREVINQSQEKIKLLNQQAKNSHLTIELYQEQYKLGKRSIVDFLSAEQEYYSALMEQQATRSDIYKQIAQFINVTGRSRTVYGLYDQDFQGFKVTN